MIRRPPRSTQSRSSAASDVYKRQPGFFSFFPGLGKTRSLHGCRFKMVVSLTTAPSFGKDLGFPVVCYFEKDFAGFCIACNGSQRNIQNNIFAVGASTS